MPVEAFSFEKPEFSPRDLPKKLLGNGNRVEEFRDDDIPSIQDAPGMMGSPDRQKVIMSKPARGSVTQLRANVSSSPRSENVQTPLPLSRPMEKKAVLAAPKLEDDLAEIAGGLEAVDLSKYEATATEMPKLAAAAPAQASEVQKEAAPTSIFSSSLTLPSAFDRALIEKYGIQWLEWTPETLWQTIRADWKTQLARVNQDKISAVVLLHVSDSFWKHWEVFEKVTLAFNNVMPHFDRHQEVTVGQMLHAVAQASEIRKEEFESEVLSYIAARTREEGMLWLPSPLDVAQPRLDQLNPPEVIALKKEVRERWDAFQDADLRDVEFREDVYGIHLARLASIDLYLKSMSTSGAFEE